MDQGNEVLVKVVGLDLSWFPISTRKSRMIQGEEASWFVKYSPGMYRGFDK